MRLSILAKHKKFLAIILAAAIAAGGGIAWKIHTSATTAATSQEQLEYARTVFLKRGDLNESVNVSGIVQSAEVSSVTTALTSKVTAVNVKVGDQVNKGDVICTLDDSEIQKSIQEKKRELEDERQRLQDAANKALAQLNDAKKAKETEKSNQDLRIKSAAAARDAASAALDSVTPSYSAAKQNYDTMMQAVASAQTEADAASAARQSAYNVWVAAGGAENGAEYEAYQAAEANQQTKLDALKQAQTLYSYDTYNEAYQQAKQAYDAAVQTKAEAQANYDQTNAAALQALDSCDTAINSALSAYQEADKAVKKGVSNRPVEELEKSLADTVLRAESAGKVTELKVNVGSICKGEVATIQSTEKLLVAVTIPEYAIKKVQQGMTVKISSDTLQEGLTGKVSRISPTAVSAENGSGNGFSADISIDQPSSIFIGSKAKAEIIISSQANVLSVPLDAVGQNAQGEDVIYVKQADGTFTPVVVKTGAKNDYSIEVQASSLSEGTEVLVQAMMEMGTTDSQSVAKQTESTEGEGGNG